MHVQEGGFSNENMLKVHLVGIFLKTKKYLHRKWLKVHTNIFSWVMQVMKYYLDRCAQIFTSFVHKLNRVVGHRDWITCSVAKIYIPKLYVEKWNLKVTWTHCLDLNLNHQWRGASYDKYVFKALEIRE